MLLISLGWLLMSTAQQVAALPTGPELLARSAQLQSSRKTLEGQDLGEEVLRASILFNLLLG